MDACHAPSTLPYWALLGPLLSSGMAVRRSRFAKSEIMRSRLFIFGELFWLRQFSLSAPDTPGIVFEVVVWNLDDIKNFRDFGRPGYRVRHTKCLEINEILWNLLISIEPCRLPRDTRLFTQKHHSETHENSTRHQNSILQLQKLRLGCPRPRGWPVSSKTNPKK